MHKIKKWILDEICDADNAKKGLIWRFRILIPHICGYLGEQYVEEELKKMEKYEYVIKEDENLDKLIEILKNYSKKEVDRDNIIYDKVKSSLFVIVLSITFLIGIFKFIDSINQASEILMVIGLIYLFFSGITAVQSILPRKYHNVLIKDKINIDQIFSGKNHDLSNEKKKSLDKKYFEISMFKDKRVEAINLYRSIILNDQIILIKINYMDVTFHGIILGTLFITASFIVMIII